MNYSHNKHKVYLWLILPAALILTALAVVFFVTRHNQNDTHLTKQDTGSNSPNSQETTPLIEFDNLTSDQKITGDTTILPKLTGLRDVERVELLVDDTVVDVSHEPPFQLSFSVDGFAEGSHSAHIVAYDSSGKEYASEPITFTLDTSDPAQRTDPPNTAQHQPLATTRPTKPNRPASSPPITAPTEPSPVPPSDTTPPTAVADLTLATTQAPMAKVTLSWSPSSDESSSVSYRVFRDDQLISSTADPSYIDPTVVPGHNYDYRVQAVDSKMNASASSAEESVSLPLVSLWSLSDAPANHDTDPSAIELGVRFRAHAPGKIVGIRFYKSPQNTGVHTGSVWDSSRTKLSSVVFTNESASGWQEALFTEPVSVEAGEPYVISYTAPNGHLSYTSMELELAPRSNQYLSTLYEENGVYGTPGQYPINNYNATNYWVDTLFRPNERVGADFAQTTTDTSAIHPGFPGSNNTGVPAGVNLELYRGSPVFRGSGSVTIDGKIIYGNLRILESANVTIKNSKIHGRIDIDSPTAHITLEDTEVNSGEWSNATIGFRNIDATRVNAHGGITSINCAYNCSISESWLHGQYLKPGTDWHLGGFLSNGGSDIQLTRNTIACDTPDSATGGCSGAAQLYGDFAPNENVTFDRNLFKSTPGGFCTSFGYSLGKPYGANPSNIVVTNNIWERGPTGQCAVYGATGSFLPANGNVWLNNKYDDGTPLDY